MERSAFHRLTHLGRRNAFVVSLLLAITFAAFLGLLNQPLRNEVAVRGVASLAAAGSAEAAAEVLDAWTPGHRRIGLAWLVFDFGFLLVYPLCLGVGCALAAERLQGRGLAPALARACNALSWGALLALPLGAAQNLALLSLLRSGPGEAAARVAAVCAGLELALAATALVLLLSGWAWGGLAGPRPGRAISDPR